MTEVCTTCNRPVDHAGHERWYAGADWVHCVPCRDAASPTGRMRAENRRLRLALEETLALVRAALEEPPP